MIKILTKGLTKTFKVSFRKQIFDLKNNNVVAEVLEKYHF
jgi:hypothetical protein